MCCGLARVENLCLSCLLSPVCLVPETILQINSVQLKLSCHVMFFIFLADQTHLIVSYFSFDLSQMIHLSLNLFSFSWAQSCFLTWYRVRPFIFLSYDLLLRSMLFIFSSFFSFFSLSWRYIISLYLLIDLLPSIFFSPKFSHSSSFCNLVSPIMPHVLLFQTGSIKVYQHLAETTIPSASWISAAKPQFPSSFGPAASKLSF